MAPLVDALAQLAAPWHDLYSDSTAIPVAVVFAHLAALLVGGGLALAADRATLRAVRGDAADRARQLGALAATHRPVVAALALSAATGALLFLADVEELAGSRVFWAKMVLVGLLAANGLRMTRAERALRAAPSPHAADDGRWRQLRASAMASGALWLALLLCGTILGNA